MATQFGVKAKKGLGQHFLVDESIAKRITEGLLLEGYSAEDKLPVLEIGPGTGVLTKYLLENKAIDLQVAEIDDESIEYLRKTYVQFLYSLQKRDFLQMDLNELFNGGPFAIIGNFPYNISSQIFFKILECPDKVPQVVCMLQKEVAERLVSPPGSKAYGILSVLLQSWYNMEYLFTVPEHVFLPPPKVKSGVIRLKRNEKKELGCNAELFKQIIKTCFNQRRKTIRNSIKPIVNSLQACDSSVYASPLMEKRPEQLSVGDFIDLTNLLSQDLQQMKN